MTKKKSFERIRKMLLRRREEILGNFDTSIERGSVVAVPDENDAASFAAEGDLALRIATMESDALSEIDQALARIDAGEYGVCLGCGEPIAPARLKALPYATLCVKCKELEEKGLLDI